MKYFILIFLATSVECEIYQEFHRYLDRTHYRQNLVGSSYSAEMAIGMLSVGAGGETVEELWNALDLTDEEDVAERFENLLHMLSNSIYVDNLLFLRDVYNVKDTYKELIREHFQGTIYPTNMTVSKEVDDEINSFVEELTYGRIQKLSLQIGPDVNAILINTVYFKGIWATKFLSDNTEEELFIVSATKRVPVQMMSMRHHFKTESLKDLDARVIELDFKKGGLVMIIYLPNQVGGLAKLEERIKDTIRPKEVQYLNLKLPKFRISTKTKLKPFFNHLGIHKAFGPSANFSGIVEDRQQHFFLEDIIQEAFIEINENGAVAASVGAVEERSPKMVNHSFIVNVPFAYIIRDNSEVYFQGHVIQPEWF